MKRKIIKQGLGGYTIYLPKEWIERKGLKEGAEVEIQEIDNSLLIKSESVKSKETTIEITEQNKRDIKVILTHIYRNGSNKITIKEVDDKIIEIIKETTKNLLLGFEITEKNTNTVIIENISEPTDQKFEVLLRRIFLIIKETQIKILTELEKNGKELDLKEVLEYTAQLDKYVLFCRRVVAKEKYNKNNITMWELLTFLTHIQHAQTYMYTYAYENKIKPSKEAIKLLESQKEYFETYYNAYFKKDISYVHELNNLKKKFQFGECITRLEKSKGKDTVIHSYIREIFRLIQIGSSPILSELVDKDITSI